MNNNTDIGNKMWFVILSLLASIVALIVFITGKNLPDFWANASPTPRPTSTNVIQSTPTESQITPTKISTPNPTVTIQPTSTQAPVSIPDDSPDYLTSLSASTDSGVLVQFFAGNYPIKGQELGIYPIQENVAGDLFCGDRIEHVTTDLNGEAYVNLSPGTYGVFEIVFQGYRNGRGPYGINFPKTRNCPYPDFSTPSVDMDYPIYGAVFPVREKNKTILRIDIPQVEIGIIYQGEAIPKVIVCLYTLGQEDVQKGCMGTGDKGPHLVSSKTLNDGIAYFWTGYGSYSVCYQTTKHSYNWNCDNRITIPIGEKKLTYVIDAPYMEDYK